MALTVSVCQFAPSADREANRARMADLIAAGAARGAKLVVLPEYSSYFVDPMDASLAENAERLDGEFVEALTRSAGAHEVLVIAGFVEGTDDGRRVRNTLVAVDASGVRAVYRKQHLYDAFGQTESTWIEAGDLDAPQVVELDGFTIGMLTCYDLRFPEVARTLVDAGADVIVVPSEWVRGPLKEHHWQTLLAARAIENTAYVLAADHPTPIGVGHSAVLDPQGVTLAAVGTAEGIAIAELDRAAIARTREVNPAVRLRRYRVTPR